MFMKNDFYIDVKKDGNNNQIYGLLDKDGKEILSRSLSEIKQVDAFNSNEHLVFYRSINNGMWEFLQISDDEITSTYIEAKSITIEECEDDYSFYVCKYVDDSKKKSLYNLNKRGFISPFVDNIDISEEEGIFAELIDKIGTYNDQDEFIWWTNILSFVDEDGDFIVGILDEEKKSNCYVDVFNLWVDNKDRYTGYYNFLTKIWNYYNKTKLETKEIFFDDVETFILDWQIGMEQSNKNVDKNGCQPNQLAKNLPFDKWKGRCNDEKK